MNWVFGLGSGSVPLGSARTGSARDGLAQLDSAWAILTRPGKSASFRLCVVCLASHPTQFGQPQLQACYECCPYMMHCTVMHVVLLCFIVCLIVAESRVPTSLNMKPARGPQTMFFSNYCSGIPGLANYEMPSEVC